MFDAKPCPLVGYSSINAKVILGASFGFAGTPDVLPPVKVVSSAPSVETILIVTTVAVAGAAFNLAYISTVFDV